MPAMTDEERRAFLAEGTRTAKVATMRRDGLPHVTPVWFVLDGDDFIFSVGKATAKGYALRRDPRVCLVVDLERPPYAFVMIEGAATLSEDLDQLRHWATLIGARYMGEERAEEFGRRNGVPGELLVRVTPTHIVSESDVTG